MSHKNQNYITTLLICLLVCLFVCLFVCSLKGDPGEPGPSGPDGAPVMQLISAVDIDVHSLIFLSLIPGNSRTDRPHRNERRKRHSCKLHPSPIPLSSPPLLSLSCSIVLHENFFRDPLDPLDSEDFLAPEAAGGKMESQGIWDEQALKDHR